MFDVYEIQYDVQLAANIMNARQKAGVTQEELARKIGTSQPAVARAENGETPPSHKLLKKIARAIGVRILPPQYVLMTEEVSAELRKVVRYEATSKSAVQNFPVVYAPYDKAPAEKQYRYSLEYQSLCSNTSGRS